MRTERTRHIPGGDRGVGLVEVLVAIALLGLVVVPLLLAVTAAVTGSNRVREVAALDTVLIDAADRLNRAPNGLCDYRLYVDAALAEEGWEDTPVSLVYRHRVRTATTLGIGPWQPGACPLTDVMAFAQSITVSITSPTGETRSVEVVKSDV